MTKLTDNQVAVFDTLNEGARTKKYVTAQDEIGMWFDTLAADSVEFGIKDKKQARVVINQLIKKGLFKVDTTVEEGSSWLEITDAGKDAWTGVLAAREPEEDLLGDVEEALHPHQDVEEGTPADEVEEALAEIEAEEAPVQTEGSKRAEALIDGLQEAFTEALAKVETHTENYTVNEWTDAEDVEWTETLFNDGSKTLKRRKSVSGAWRTDYWGTEAGADKQHFTTAKAAKMARAYGTYTEIV